MGKTAICTNLCFYPLPPLINVEKQWAKVALSYVMGSQHSIEGEGNFKHTFYNPIIFCHWLSEIYRIKRKMRFYACYFRKRKCPFMSLIMLRCTLSWTSWQQTMPKWRKNFRNTVFKLLLSSIWWKRGITSTQWKMLQFG